jgi:hypothetical protein
MDLAGLRTLRQISCIRWRMQGSEAMRHHWSDDTELARVFLDVDDRVCRHCGCKMHVCDHRRHRIETLEGPRSIICRLVKCIDRTCAGHHQTVSPEAELAICLPRSIFGWDVFCWIGHRRFSRHWSFPQIRGELQDSYQIRVSDDAIEDVIASIRRSWQLANRTLSGWRKSIATRMTWC